MPADQLKSRVRAAWRSRACAAALCTGTQVFLLGAVSGMPVALNAAWIAALAAVPASAAVAALCAGRHARAVPARRPLHALLALVLTADAVFAAAMLCALAEQTLLPQAPLWWTACLTAAAALLCAPGGGEGATRLCFALRFVLPGALFPLALVALAPSAPAGLFPVLGAGAPPLALAALLMLAGAVPALMLMLPPPSLAAGGEAALRCAAPGAGFFAWRVALGAAAGALLLALLCAGNSYEAIAANATPGARMRIVSASAPRKSLALTALTAAQMLCALLLAAHMLAAAGQALAHGWPRRALLSRALPALAFAGALAALILCAPRAMLTAAPLLALPALPTLLLSRRGAREKEAAP